MKKLILPILFVALGCFTLQAQTTLFSEDFNNGIPGPQGWATFSNVGTFTWSIAPGGGDEAGNWTDPPGTFTAASASSDEFGTGAYDTELISPVIAIPSGASNINLDMVVNYQALGGIPTDDNFDVDVSTNGGGSWTTVNAFEDDTPVGGLRTGPGVPFTFNLDGDVSAGDNMLLRFHYYNPIDGPNAFDWYAQVDNVVVTADVMATAPVPTMSEWGLIVLTLFFLNFGVVAMMRRKNSLALATGEMGSFSSGSSWFPFESKLYGKTLIGTFVLVTAVFAIAILAFGYVLTTADIPGALIATPLLAYLIHLLMKK